MTTLAPIKTLEQDAIAKKIKELLRQLPLKDRLEVEGEVSRSISEELAAKKEECGNNRKKWQECLKEAGFVPQEAEKRIKLTKIPSWLWGIGTLMVVQLASPTYNDTLDGLLKRNVITQEVVKSQMDEVNAMRKLEAQERKAQKLQQAESKFFDWSKNIYGKRVLNIVEIPEVVGNQLEQMLAVFKRASDGLGDFPLFASEVLDICKNSERWMELEAIADYNETTDITPETIPLSQVGVGMRVEIVNPNSPRFGEEATVASSYNNGGGWFVIFDSENNSPNPQSEWVNTAEVKVVAIN